LTLTGFFLARLPRLAWGQSRFCFAAVCAPTIRKKETRHHEAIKNQALGEGLQAYWLEKLSRYETHLDRKFERVLTLLIKLEGAQGELPGLKRVHAG